MSWLDQYSKYPGRVTEGEVDISSAIPIGYYLRQGRYQAFRGYDGTLKPIGVIVINGVVFIMDGRNRARASLDDGRKTVPAVIKESDCPTLEEHLLRISHFFIDEIPIRENKSTQNTHPPHT